MSYRLASLIIIGYEDTLYVYEKTMRLRSICMKQHSMRITIIVSGFTPSRITTDDAVSPR